MEVEEELKEYLILSSKIHHGLTKKECKLLAYELAEKNKLKVPNSWKVNKIAGENWLKEFHKRWPQISIRKPKSTSLARATSFNRTTVEEFFDNVISVYEKFEKPKLGPHTIYNLNEMRLTTVHNPPNVLSQKGMK
ncbi:hypothetical protein ILUMI_14534 [Ignelater luminosus]|uniref:HTH CENPB-type domain-containing protein n=1 Tax=Ignelater luminosus TaxID=2038154 RepID=A0A8K0CQB2_IGNLU|nr:hypothetical protein ILUMI_14534 [Ignelater luminosus]